MTKTITTSIFRQGDSSSKVPPLQPTPTSQFWSGGSSSKSFPLQPLLTQFRSRGNFSKVLPLQPNSYIILPPPLNTPHKITNYPLTLTSIYPHRPSTLSTQWVKFREDVQPRLLRISATPRVYVSNYWDYANLHAYDHVFFCPIKVACFWVIVLLHRIVALSSHSRIVQQSRDINTLCSANSH